MIMILCPPPDDHLRVGRRAASCETIASRRWDFESCGGGCCRLVDLRGSVRFWWFQVECAYRPVFCSRACAGRAVSTELLASGESWVLSLARVRSVPATRGLQPGRPSGGRGGVCGEPEGEVCGAVKREQESALDGFHAQNAIEIGMRDSIRRTIGTKGCIYLRNFMGCNSPPARPLRIASA